MLLGNNNDNDTQIKEYNNIINLPINPSFVSLDSFYIDNYALSKVGLQSPSSVYMDGTHTSPNNSNIRNPSLSSSNGLGSFSTTHYKFYNTSNNNNNNLNQTNFTMAATRTPTPRLETKTSRRNVRNLRPKVSDSNNNNHNDNNNKKNGNKENSINPITSSKGNKDAVSSNPLADNVRQSNNTLPTVSQSNPLIPPIRRIQRGNFIDALNGSDSDSSESTSSHSSSFSSSSSSSSCSSSSSSSSSSKVYHTNNDANSADSLPFEFAVDPERVGSVVSFDMSRFQGNGFLTNH